MYTVTVGPYVIAFQSLETPEPPLRYEWAKQRAELLEEFDLQGSDGDFCLIKIPGTTAYLRQQQARMSNHVTLTTWRDEPVQPRITGWTHKADQEGSPMNRLGLWGCGTAPRV